MVVININRSYTSEVGDGAIRWGRVVFWTIRLPILPRTSCGATSRLPKYSSQTSRISTAPSPRMTLRRHGICRARPGSSVGVGGRGNWKIVWNDRTAVDLYQARLMGTAWFFEFFFFNRYYTRDAAARPVTPKVGRSIADADRGRGRRSCVPPRLPGNDTRAVSAYTVHRCRLLRLT